MRSSERLYNMLLSNKILGPYIMEFRKNKGMTKRMKIHAIGTMWFMITISCVFFIKSTTVILVVIGVGMIGTVVMGWIVPTARKG